MQRLNNAEQAGGHRQNDRKRAARQPLEGPQFRPDRANLGLELADARPR